ncbi:LAGLIDADG family homing endonuclease [Mycobacterium sp. CnD-18-1]|uniref:LAGLIDADG family homing endonuclease n=1 Tax=Mycobacterium sp. CnD-18-1 TaxID=2917744 RepID=UPI001EF2F2AE|nr:LAGLIDADG family homing endonuclease [Mycobacterium sp. CnD-18-1]MCG7607161.1 hypothetical protein [Mycobacterium sp. CnD-18-1]
MQSFRLSANFLEPYKASEPAWGWADAAGNSIGELTFVRTYSRVKQDGSKEKWWEVCERVINGMYSLLKDHCLNHRLEWNGNKAQASAQEAYDRMFHFKWTPPGRGLFQMGTELVMQHKNAASLLNCAMVSTGDMERHDPGYPFAWTTEALMLGIGVGFDTLGAGKFDVLKPGDVHAVYEIPDTREGWAISVGKLINSYLKPGKGTVEFDYSLIRPYGSPIKTFGGTASGPEPLAEGHDRIRKVLNENVGSALTAKTIVDIQNIIGTFVVAGNTRRSAELALGLPSDEGFVDLKNHEVYPDRPWAFMSNNSISATVGMDYGPFLTNTAVNGEPGYVWLDTARKYGRLIDPPDFKDARVAGFNPCLTASTWIQTAEGPRQISELIGKKFVAIVDGKPYNCLSDGFFKTGHKSVYKLVTEEGWSAEVTANHEVYRPDGTRVEVRDLKVGDKIRLSDHRGIVPWSGRGTEIEGYTLGWLIGDGYFGSDKNLTGRFRRDDGRTSLPHAVIQSQGKPETERSRKEMGDYVLSLPHRSDFKGWSGPYGEAGQYRLGSRAFSEVAESYGIVKGNKTVTDEVERTSWDFHVGLLRGLFDTDGHVEYSPNAGVSVRLASIDKLALEAAQRMLSRLGIRSSIRGLHEEHDMTCPNTGNVYTSKKSYRLLITNRLNVMRFQEVVGFWHDAKAAKLAAGIDSYRAEYKTKFEATFLSGEYLREDDVFDCTIDRVYDFCGNGLYMRDCVEQPLESFEMCCLVEAHLNRAESKEDFLRTLKFAYLYGKAVTLLTTPWEKTNAVMLRNRRIGLSTTGVAGFVEDRSLAEYRVWADEGYKRVGKWDVTYSEWLGVRESIRKTTVKPSGSVSLLSGATPGVHWPPGGEYFVRAIRFGDHDNAWRLLERAGYKVEDDVYSPNTKVVYFPLRSNVKRAEGDVSIFEKIHLAAEAQKYWSDNGVSVTVSFDPETESEAVGQVLGMYEGQLKAVSFLPMGNAVYEQQPYTRISESEYEEMSGGLRRIDLAELYNSSDDAEGEVYCTTDSCSIK